MTDTPSAAQLVIENLLKPNWFGPETDGNQIAREARRFVDALDAAGLLARPAPTAQVTGERAANRALRRSVKIVPDPRDALIAEAMCTLEFAENCLGHPVNLKVIRATLAKLKAATPVVPASERESHK